VKTGYSRNCVNDFLNKTKRKEKKRQLIAWFFKCKKRIIQVLQLYIYNRKNEIMGRNEKKIEKSRKPEKNNWKNQTVKKNRLKFKKTNRFSFGFISLKPNRTKTKKIKTNRFEPVFILKNQTKLKLISLNQF